MYRLQLITLRALVLSTFLFSSSLSASPELGFTFSPPAGWNESKTSPTVVTWAPEDSKKTVFSVVSHKNDDPVSLEKIPTVQLLQATTAARSAGLEQIGVRDWTVTKSERINLSDPKGTLLKFEGYYTGNDQLRVEFVEWQYYLEKRFVQATLTRRGENAKWSSKEFTPIFKRLKVSE